jgi:hypothetical protein
LPPIEIALSADIAPMKDTPTFSSPFTRTVCHIPTGAALVEAKKYASKTKVDILIMSMCGIDRDSESCSFRSFRIQYIPHLAHQITWMASLYLAWTKTGSD